MQVLSGDLGVNPTYTYIGSTQGPIRNFLMGNQRYIISLLLIHNRALTQSEVIQNFNAHKSRYGL
jgi:hypothetical protein